VLFIFLFVLLLIVIIFRKEIKNIIVYGFLATLAFALWHVAWWGALLVIALFAVPFFGGMIFEYYKGRRQSA